MKGSFAAARRSFAVFVYLFLSLMSAQAYAQGCNANANTPFAAKIDPVSQTVPQSILGTPTTVQLSGSSNVTPSTFKWEHVTGPSVTLSSTTAANPTFVAPNLGPTMVRLKLTATCIRPSGQPLSHSVTTDINITSVVTNAPPTALASASPEIAHEGDPVDLDGTASYDIDPGTTLTYSWEQTGIGDKSPEVTLSPVNAAGSIVRFTAPNTPNETGAVLNFRLTVSDGTLTGTTDRSVNIVWTNDPPIASLVCPAGGVLEVDEGDLVQLDGSGSLDTDGSIVSYAWSQEAGLPRLQIGELNTSSLSFNAPMLGYEEVRTLKITLFVEDDLGATDDASCGLWINDKTPPVIEVPAGLTLQADSAAGKAFSYSVEAMDAVDDREPYTLAPEACEPISGSVFPLADAPVKQKVTTVLCSALDSADNEATASFNVTVEDTTAPQIDVPESLAVADAERAAGSIVNYGPIATRDVVDGDGVATCWPASGERFPIASTTVNCSAVDARENVSHASFLVVVHDLTGPVFGRVPDVVAEAQFAAGAVVNYDLPSAVDAVDGPVAVTCVAAPGATFALGRTTVRCSASDSSDNVSRVEFEVIVQDTTPPTLTLPADFTAEATSASGAVVRFTPSASDLVDASVTVVCAPASGSTFPLGTTAVSCSATDDAGKSASGGFNVRVVDTTAPVIAPQADWEPIEAFNAAGAQVFYGTVTTSDAVDGTGEATCAPASGAVFPIGQTTVTCDASDAAGNDADSKTFLVTVHDTTRPEVTAPANVVSVEADAPLTRVNPGTASDSDAVGVVRRFNDAPVPPVFPVGTTTINWYAEDAAGNRGRATSTVTVVDTTAPVLSGVSGNIGSVQATSASGAVVSWDAPSAADLVDSNLAVTCAPASGSTFAIGTTNVTCSASDSAIRSGYPNGNVAMRIFSVTVVDTAPPVLTGISPDLTVEAASAAGTVVTWPEPTALDVVDRNRTVACSPASGSLFPFVVGGPAHAVTCSASDSRGNTASAGFTVTVVDLTAPVISGATDQTLTASSSARAGATFALTAADTVDPTVAVACSHEPGDSFAPGDTLVTCSATDDSGNRAEASFTISVRYGWSNFLRPIDIWPVTNTVKAGSGIPVKFSLGGNMGLSIIEAGYPKSVRIACNEEAVEAEVETTVTAGGSSLTYDATANQYVYVWKTDKAWAGTCRQLQVQLADGSTRKDANFKFTK